jgi:CoA-dependent NAD(P)H sulfur oxidoreductase
MNNPIPIATDAEGSEPSRGVRRILIIGGVAAGMKAAATARRRNQEVEIIVLQDEAEVSYSACGFPYHLADQIAIPRAKLIARSVAQFREDRIDLRVRHRVEGVDLDSRTATVNDIAAARDHVIPFDEVIFATGARTVTPPITVTRNAIPVVALRSFAQADRLRELMPAVRRFAIIGGGYIGLETAETFRLLGATVTVVEAMPQLLSQFDQVVRDAVAAQLSSHGVGVRVGTSVTEVTSAGIALRNGGFIEADAVLTATGVRPMVDLMVAAGVPLGPTGAVAVDDRMQTRIEGVYAAGDCAEARHFVSDKPVWYPLGDVANRQARVAGTNAAGGSARFPGVLGTAIFRVFDLAVARTGLSLAQARDAGFDPVRIQIQAPSRARYIPQSRPIELILIVDRPSGRVLGGEAVGPDGVDKCIDTIATAIWGRLSVDDLAELDLAYAPPFSPVMAPVQVAAEVARKEVRRARD